MTREEAAKLDELANTIGLIVGLLRPQLPALKKVVAHDTAIDDDSARRAALALVGPIFEAAVDMVETCDRHLARSRAALAAVTAMRR